MSITTGLTGSIVQAFSWMLIHSLWQGLLLSILAGIILMLTRKAGATIRYNLVLALFAVFLFTVAVTFFYEWNNIQTQAQAELALAGSSKISVSSYSTIIYMDNTHSGNAFSHYNFKDFIKNFSDYFSAHSFLVVMLWFIFFIAKSVSMAGNVLYMQRARHYRVYAPTDEWKKKLETLCEKLQLKRAVLLLESGYVKVPVVIGHLKPVILIPVGLIAGIPAEQVEAVLLHELAHIRRNDYVVNFLQNITETMFFFNPGLLWISSLLKEERENCCDDMAIAQTNSKEDFVQALISFKAYSLNTPAHAIAFSGQKSTLLNRVMRIVYQENKTLSVKENGIFIMGIAVLVLTAFTIYPAKEAKRALHSSTSKSNTATFLRSLKKPLNEASMPETTSLIKDPVANKIADSRLSQTEAADSLGNSKFYSRTDLGNGTDLIQFRLHGTGGKATLPHNGKVAFIINGVIHEESEMANFTRSQISVFDTGASGIGSTLNAKERFPDLDLSKYDTYIAIGLDYKETMKEMGKLPEHMQAATDKLPPVKKDTIPANKDMSKMSMRDLIPSLKFDDSKFYSRIVLDGGNYDMIRFRVAGKGMGMIDLPHNAKVALIINGVIHDESEINNFTESQISDFITGRWAISRTINAKEAFPDLDLSKYGAYIAIGSDIGNINTNYQPALNKGYGPIRDRNAFLNLIPDLKVNADGTISHDNKPIIRARLNGKTIDEAKKDNGLNIKLNSTMDTLLRSMPGMKINADGTVSHDGNIITKARLNGKDYPVGGIKAKPDSSAVRDRGGSGGGGGAWVSYGP